MSIITPNRFTLYQYTNRLNSKRYIGVTNDPARRFREHSRGWGHARAFNAAIKKYGIEVFDYKILAIFDDNLVAAYHEQAAILEFGTLTPDGYNLLAGAPCTIYSGTLSEETRKKISTSHKGKIASAETRTKISIAGMGNKRSLGFKQPKEIVIKRSNAMMGNKYALGKAPTPETRAKLSAALKGNQRTLGYKHTAETCAQMSKNRLGRKFSVETRKKISAAKKAYWAKIHSATKDQMQ